MATFEDLKRQASLRLQDENNTAVSASSVGSAINSAIQYWKNTEFWFNTATDSVTLTIGDPVLPSGSVDFLYLMPRFGMRIPYQQMFWDIRKVDPMIYDGGNVQTQGLPYQYTVRNREYRLYYYPDQAYTVNLLGVKDYSDLVNPTDTNDFTQYADQMILYDALSRLTAELRTDPTMSDYYTKRRDDEKWNALKRTNRLNKTGRALPDDSLRDNNYYYY